MLERLAWCAAFTAAIAIGVVVVVGPSSLGWSRGFIAWPAPYDAAIPVGDHLQMTYFFWLWRDALATRSHWPWSDPFQFRATGLVTHQPFGWPLVLLFLPVDLLSGPIAGYNALVLASFPACAFAAYTVARELGASREGAAVGGWAFAFAPWRLVRTAVHVSGLLAFLVPLVFWSADRALAGAGARSRRAAWAFAFSYVSLIGSGDLQLALHTSALLAVYLLVRRWGVAVASLRAVVVPAFVAAIGSAAIATLMYVVVLAPSVAGGGRSAAERISFGPRLADLVAREVTWLRFETYAYPGAAIAGLAAVGVLVGLATADRRRATIGLLSVVTAAYALALMPAVEGHPALARLYESLPLFRFSRTPGRILLVAAFGLSVLAAFAFDAIRRRGRRSVVAVVCAAAILADRPFDVFRFDPAASDALAAVPPGATILHLPPFEPGHFSGSVYPFLATTRPGPMTGGYNPFVTPAVRDAQATTFALAAAPLDPCRWRERADAMGIEYVAVHLDLYGQHYLQWQADGPALVAALDASPAFTRLPGVPTIAIFHLDPTALPCATARP